MFLVKFKQFGYWLIRLNAFFYLFVSLDFFQFFAVCFGVCVDLTSIHEPNTNTDII